MRERRILVPDEEWRRLVEIHGHAKALILQAEELDQEQQLFVQPLLELRSALDHVLRSVAAEVGVTNHDAEYARHNFDKAIGHVYRAFFDAADWLTIRVRDMIVEDIRPFDPATVSAVVPDYYSSIRPRVEQIAREVAGLRENKDVAKTRDNEILLREVAQYRTAIEDLMAIRRTIGDRLTAMYEHRRSSMWHKYKFWIITSVGGAVVIGLSIRWLGKVLGI